MAKVTSHSHANSVEFLNSQIAQLLRKRRAAQESDLQILFDRDGSLWNRMVTIANQVLRDDAESQDVAQSVSASIVERLRERQRIQLSAFLNFCSRAAYWKALNEYRARRARHFVDLPPGSLEYINDLIDIAYRLDNDQSPTELPDEVKEAILRLPPTPRLAVVLGALGEDDDEAIAARLGVSSVNKLRVMRHRAYEQLRKRLGGRRT